MGTEIERLAFELDAAQYVREAQRMINTNQRLAANFAAVEKSSLRIGGNGDLTAQIRGIDREGRRLSQTLRQVGGEFRVVRSEFSSLESSSKSVQNSLDQLQKGITNLGKVAGISVLVGSVFRLQRAFEDSLKAAADFSIRIAEIDTIQANAALSTSEWANELRSLSSEFGIDTLKQAEAAYQTLSNQIAQGEEAIRFLDSANRLAITGVTDTASAVNLLSSTINAFRLPVEQAEILSAQFFKTVELGRLRIDEISDSFGRVAVPAAQLGVSVQELQAALAVTTNQGVKANEAFTFIRNIFQKLIRPGNDLKNFFAELGVESGEAAIQTFGLSGFLARLEQRTRGSSTEIGNLFQRIRAISGALVFAGDGVDQFQRTLAAIEGTTVNEFLADFNKVAESTGQQLKIAQQTARNFFERELGGPALRTLVDITKGLGGMEEILTEALRTLRAFGLVLGATFVTTRVVTGIGALTTALRAQTVATSAATASTLGLRAALTTLLPVAAAVGAVLASEQFVNSQRDALKAAEEANLGILRDREAALKESQNQEERQTKTLRDEVDKRAQAINIEIASRQANLNNLQKQSVNTSREITKEIVAANKTLTKELSNSIRENKKSLDQAERDTREATNNIRSLFEEISRTSLRFDLDSAGLGQQVSILNAEIEESQRQAAQAAEQNDLRRFQIASARVRQLTSQRVDAEIALQRQVNSLDGQLQDQRSRLARSNSRRDRELAQRRISQIQRELRLVKEGTSEQVKAQRQIQSIQNQINSSAPDELEGLFKALQDARKEQELIEDSARRERQIRLDGQRQLQIQVQQLQQIRQQSEEKRRQEEAVQRQLQIQQFLFSSISQEAQNFKQERILGLKSEEQLIRAVQAQQERLSQLVSLQRSLGAGGRVVELTQQRQLQLQEAAQRELERRREEQRRKDVNAAREAIDLGLQASARQQTNNRVILDAVQKRLETLSRTFQQAIQASEANPAVGNLIGRIFSNSDNAAEIASVPQDFQTLRDNTSRLAELIKALQNRPSVADQREFNAIFERTRKELANFAVRSSQQLTGNVSFGQAFDAEIPSVRPLFNALTDILQPSQGRTPFSNVPQALQTQQESLRLLINRRNELAAINNKITAQRINTDETEKSSRQVKEFSSNIENLQSNIERLNRLANPTRETRNLDLGPANIPSIQNLINSDSIQTSNLVESLKDTTERGVQEGFNQGAQRSRNNILETVRESTTKGFEQALQSTRRAQIQIGREVAEEQARQSVRANRRVAPDIALNQARLEAAQRRRLEILNQSRNLPQLRQNPISNPQFIRFGPNQPSIQQQQARIQREFNLNRQRNTLQNNFEISRPRPRRQNLTAPISAPDPEQQAALETALRLQLEKNRAEQERIQAIKNSTVVEIDSLRSQRQQTENRIQSLQEIDPRQRSNDQQRELRVSRERLRILERTLIPLERDASELRQIQEINERIKEAQLKQAEFTERSNREAAFGVVNPPIDAQSRAIEQQLQIDLETLRQNRRSRQDTELEDSQLRSRRSRLINSGLPLSPDAVNSILGGNIQVTTSPESLAAAQLQKQAALDQAAAAGDLRAAAELQKSAAQRLAERQLAFQQARGFQSGGLVTGPNGIDRIPAMLSNGEFVVNRRSTNQFLPQLLAMNTGRFQPPGFQDGSVDVGGINVTVNESTSPQITARTIAREINRGIRSGTIKIRGS